MCKNYFFFIFTLDFYDNRWKKVSLINLGKYILFIYLSISTIFDNTLNTNKYKKMYNINVLEFCFPYDTLQKKIIIYPIK